MSQDSFEARRVLRAAQRGEESDEEGEEVEGDVGQDQVQDGALLRPGEEAVHEDGMQPDDAQAAATKRSRPKLTYEMLTAATGIPTVFGTFREALHRQRSGRGNPAKDLGILLDLYEQWQKQVFPHTDFDTFTKKVSGLYGKPGGKQTTGATLKGDVRELRESVIQVALDHMVETLNNEKPAEEGLDEGMAQQSDEHERAGAAHPGDSMAQSAAGEGLFEPLQELPVNDNTDSQGFTDLNSQAMGKGGGFDPDELMHLQPVVAEDGDEFDDMLC